MKISRVNNFDLIRLLAALQVVINHGYHHFELVGVSPAVDWLYVNLIQFFPGVPIFFAMSGFLIFNSYHKNPDLKRYFKNRFLRLYPGLWLAFLVTFTILVIFGFISGENLLSKQSLLWIGGQLSFVHFYTPDMLRGYGLGNPNGSLWTITVELQYYFIVPILVYFISRLKLKTNWVLLGLIVISAVSNYLLSRNLNSESMAFKLATVWLLPYLFYFLIGAVVYMNFDKLSRFIENKGLQATLIYFGYYIVFSRLTGLYFPGYWPSLTGMIASVFMIYMVFGLAFTRKGLANMLLKRNDLSYGIYVYHVMIINVIIHLYDNYTFNTFFIYAIISVLCGWASWKFIEHPALKLKNRKIAFFETNNTRS